MHTVWNVQSRFHSCIFKVPVTVCVVTAVWYYVTEKASLHRWNRFITVVWNCISVTVFRLSHCLFILIRIFEMCTVSNPAAFHYSHLFWSWMSMLWMRSQVFSSSLYIFCISLVLYTQKRKGIRLRQIMQWHRETKRNNKCVNELSGRQCLRIVLHHVKTISITSQISMPHFRIHMRICLRSRGQKTAFFRLVLIQLFH